MIAIRRALLLVAALLALVSSGSARAWTIEAGVILDDDEDTTYLLTEDIEVLTDAYWDGDAFVLAPFGFEFDTEFGCSWDWNITEWAPPFNVSFQSGNPCFGTARFTGFPGFYEVSGLSGYPDFTISGPTFTVNIVPGTQEFSVRLTSLATSGLRLLASSRWNPDQSSIGTAGTILDATGNPIGSALVNHTLLRPDGSTFSSVTMDASSVLGVYVANVSVPESEPDGVWTVTVSYGGTVVAESVYRGSVDAELNGLIETAVDPYIPVLVFGGFMIFCLYFRAWAPAVAAGLALGNHILPDPVWGLGASIMLIILFVALHTLASQGIFSRRSRS